MSVALMTDTFPRLATRCCRSVSRTSGDVALQLHTWIDGSICLYATAYKDTCPTLDFPAHPTYDSCCQGVVKAKRIANAEDLNGQRTA